MTKNDNNVRRQIESHLDAAHKIALAHVIIEAKSIMIKRPFITCFSMGMGMWSFTTTLPRPANVLFNDDRAYLRKLCAFIDEFDEELHITGNNIFIRRIGGEIVIEKENG